VVTKQQLKTLDRLVRKVNTFYGLKKENIHMFCQLKLRWVWTRLFDFELCLFI